LQPVDRLSNQRLAELSADRQVLRYSYGSLVTLRDADPSNQSLASCVHLLYNALTLLDSALDDLEANENTARGAVTRVNEVLAEVAKIKRSGTHAEEVPS
jgi:hypothetical protein